jgi:glutamate dehydrogenase (NAD(P)+)
VSVNGPASAPHPRDGSPYFSATWTDPVTEARGYLVIDTLIRGIAGGGLRMRRGCTLQEVADLARAMTLKEAISYSDGARYVPLGGAKGGIDFDPLDPQARDVLRRYLEAMLPLLQTRWATGEDLGVRQDDLDQLAAELGLRSTVDAALPQVADGAEAGLARLAAAFAARERDIGLGELVGGYGVARAALSALEARGQDPRNSRAVIQGFGSMGGATVRYLADSGVRIVGIADAAGLVVNDDGLDVEALLRRRDRHGRIDRTTLRRADSELPREAWASRPCDVAIPAATSYAIDERVARSMDCAMWTLFGDIEPTPAAAFAAIDQTIGTLVAEAFARREPGKSRRSAGMAMAAERAAAARR